MPATVPHAVVDALNSLLEAEQNSVFRFMGEGSPYLSRAAAEVRQPLARMVETHEQHCHELHDLIESLGGVPRPRVLQMEEQYLAYLSIKFLLPKLVNDKGLVIRRYEGTIKAIPQAPPQVTEVLQRHLAEHRVELAALERAAAHVLRPAVGT